MKIKNPPIIVLFDGISLIPKIGIQTQNIPPITSVSDNNVSSAAWIDFDPIEYKIKPIQTIVPCTENKPWFLLDEIKLLSVSTKIIIETIAQNRPAKATVVNVGVSFLHLKETEKIENPIAEASPNTKPNNVPAEKFPKAIMQIPTEAKTIEIHTLIEIRSLRNIKPKNAVINGIAAKHSKVTAADVFVIDQINEIIAIANPIPPIKPDHPILL